MLNYFLRRIVYMVLTVVLVSLVSFVVIQLPPGDYLTTMLSQMEAQGDVVAEELEAALRVRYGLDRPMHEQYFTWVSRIVTRLDFGYSFSYNQPVRNLLGERLVLTVTISLIAMLFTWVIAFPIGIISAVKQYSVFDYFATFIGFLGLAIPNFLLALVLLWVTFEVFGYNASGLFSQQYINAPWSMDKILDMLSRVWLPMIVVGTAGTAGLIRTMRANMLDELRKPYVTTARAKGLVKAYLIIKYPVRIALNPFVSSIAWMFPRLVSGMAITAIVLNLPTLGPLLLNSLQNQDMYLAGSIVLIMCVLTVIGFFVSDMLLALVDPRIRYQ